MKDKILTVLTVLGALVFIGAVFYIVGIAGSSDLGLLDGAGLHKRAALGLLAMVIGSATSYFADKAH